MLNLSINTHFFNCKLSNFQFKSLFFDLNKMSSSAISQQTSKNNTILLNLDFDKIITPFGLKEITCKICANLNLNCVITPCCAQNLCGSCYNSIKCMKPYSIKCGHCDYKTVIQNGDDYTNHIYADTFECKCCGGHQPHYEMPSYGVKCPYCRVVGDEFKTNKDKIDLVLKHRTRCNISDECKVESKLSNYPKHHQFECEYRITICEICDLETIPKHHDLHREVCAITCKLCDQRCLVKDLDHHLDTICKSKCTQCKKVILNKNKESHVNECFKRCTYCKTCILSSGMVAHIDPLMPECNKAPRACELCNKHIDYDLYESHQYCCDKRPEECPSCKMTVTHDVFNEHKFKTCGELFMHCPNRCGMDIQLKDMRLHRRQICPKQNFKCANCKNTFIAEEKEAHKSICPDEPRACKHIGCVASVPRRDITYHETTCKYAPEECLCGKSFINYQLGEHRALDCPETMVPCYLCLVVDYKRKDREAHLEKCLQRQVTCECSKIIAYADLYYHKKNNCLEGKENCAYCQESIKRKDMFAHQVGPCINREVACGLGCNQVVRYHNADRHRKEICLFRDVECECGETMFAHRLSYHKSALCPNTIINCTFCKEDYRKIDEAEHVKTCERVHCPNSCGIIIKKGNINHVNNECKSRNIKCICGKTLPAHRMNDHTFSCGKIECPNRCSQLIQKDDIDHIKNKCRYRDYIKNKCRYRDYRSYIKCNKCGDQVVKNMIRNHLESECKECMIACKHCDKKVFSRWIVRHLKWECIGKKQVVNAGAGGIM